MAENSAINASGLAEGFKNFVELMDEDGNRFKLIADNGELLFKKNGNLASVLSGNRLGFGAAETVTIASGVATLGAGSYFKLAAESSTADQLDTITKADAVDGDVILLSADAGDTITVDDANIDLGGATRALVGPTQFLALVFTGGGQWSELAFAAGDNS